MISFVYPLVLLVNDAVNCRPVLASSVDCSLVPNIDWDVVVVVTVVVMSEVSGDGGADRVVETTGWWCLRCEGTGLYNDGFYIREIIRGCSRFEVICQISLSGFWEGVSPSLMSFSLGPWDGECPRDREHVSFGHEAVSSPTLSFWCFTCSWNFTYSLYFHLMSL